MQVADRYDQWVRTGNDEHRAAASAAAESILPLLEKLRAYHQGRLDKAQADIIRDDGNPEVLYDQHWWQVDRGFTLAAAGQLSWLHYRLAMLNPGKAEQRKGWLKKSVAEFSEFVAAGEERMRLESLLGRWGYLVIFAAMLLENAGVPLPGETVTLLRPSGRARIGDDFLDVVSEGAFVPAGRPIIVVDVTGNRVVVREA